MYKPIRRVDLVEGGTVIRQGDYFTLGLQPFDSNGEIPDLSDKVIVVVIAQGYKIFYETTADFRDNVIYFTVDDNIGSGTFNVELTVTDSSDESYKHKYPADDSLRITLTPSTDDLEKSGAGVITVAMLKDELRTIQEDYEVRSDERIDNSLTAVEEVRINTEAERVATENVKNETLDAKNATEAAAALAEEKALLAQSKSDLVDERMTELEDVDAVQFDSRLNSVTQQLADKANQSDLEMEASRINNLVAHAGDTDGNAELLDIRVVNGTIYDTAGEAVRSILTLAQEYADLKTANVLVAKDASELQPFADQLEALGGGVLQLLPNREYTLETTLTLGDNVTLRGAGWSTVITISDNAPLTEYQLESARSDHPGGIARIYPIITNRNRQGERNKGIVIENLTVDGNGDNQPINRGQGQANVWFHNAQECTMRDVKAVNSVYDADRDNGHHAFCVLIMFSSEINITSCYLERAGYETVGIRDGAENIVVDRSTIKHGKSHCVQLAMNWLRRGIGGKNVTISDCIIINDGDGRNGITTHYGEDATIKGCLIDVPGRAIFLFESSHRITVTNNQIRTNQTSVYLGRDNASEPLSTNLIFSNNQVECMREGITSHAVMIGKAERVTVEGNRLRSLSGDGVNALRYCKDINVKNNLIECVRTGVYLEGPSHCLVTGNIVLSALRGVTDDGNSDQVLVKDNDVYGATHTTEKIRINGTNKIVKDNLPMDAQ